MESPPITFLIMKGCWVLLLLAASKGEPSVIDVFVSLPIDQDDLRFRDYNISVPSAPVFSIKLIYEGPVFILVPNPSQHPFGVKLDELTAYYSERGLRGIVSERNFEGLHEQLLNIRHISALAYPGGEHNFFNFLPAKVTRMVLPDNFAVHRLIQGAAHGNLHLLYILPRDLFNAQPFTGIKRVARFIINDYSVETIWSEDPTLPFTKKLSYTSTAEDEVQSVFPFIPPGPSYIDQLQNRGYRQVPSEPKEKLQKTKEELVALSKS